MCSRLHAPHSSPPDPPPPHALVVMLTLLIMPVLLDPCRGGRTGRAHARAHSHALQVPLARSFMGPSRGFQLSTRARTHSSARTAARTRCERATPRPARTPSPAGTRWPAPAVRAPRVGLGPARDCRRDRTTQHILVSVAANKWSVEAMMLSQRQHGNASSGSDSALQLEVCCTPWPRRRRRGDAP